MNIIQFPQLGKNGRLGNQLFQIAATIGIAFENDCEPRFPDDWKYRKHFNITPIWFRQMKPLPTVRELSFEYQPYKVQNVSLNGYFQSERYWRKYHHLIKNYLGYTEKVEPYCAIHHRRGDYIDNPYYVTLPMSYYVNAYLWQYLQTEITDIKAVSDDKAFIRLHYSQDCGSELDDLETLKKGASKILSNSTFSWWGAYLGLACPVRPSEYFNGALKKYTTKDFWPSDWHYVDSKPDAEFWKQFAFVIPVKYDHQDRLENCKAVVKYLKEHFPDVPVYIGEMDGDHFKGIANHWQRYDLGGVMHRTKVINLLTKWAAGNGAKYVFNWDADVIAPPMQIANAIALLHKGADVVYPYDGRFYWLERKELQHIHGDLRGLVGRPFRTVGATVKDPNSYGGAVGYNVQSFFSAGGENERMVSYAPEDQERWHRFNLLLSNVKRTFGGLYHINHWRGNDSSFKHKNGNSNMAEWMKEKAMNNEQLRAYVDGWEWCR